MTEENSQTPEEGGAEVKPFDASQLQHVETEENSQTREEADAAFKPFDASKLKHVETEEKTVLPTAEMTQTGTDTAPETGDTSA